MDYSSMSPAEVRALIREGKITGPTAGMCAGYAQANLVILPKDLAYDFLLFTQRNPKSCPLLEVSDVGGKGLSYLGKNVDIYKDIPKYRIYENGELTGEYTDVSRFYREDLVSFLIGMIVTIQHAMTAGWLNFAASLKFATTSCRVARSRLLR